jgi:flavin reductase (DIM6/NTAB) family NADH-FMN oxidoreductase RutF
VVTKDFRTMERRETYRVLSSVVVPRPIAWVTTLGADGTLNLAPFSSFQGIFNPPVLSINVGRRRDGSLKDTHRNIRERGEAVVHLADRPLLEALHASGEEVAPEVSEAARLGLETAPSQVVAPPRLAEAPVALECRLRQEVELDERSTVVLLDVLVLHAADRLWDAQFDCGRGDLWEPVARLVGGQGNGPNYALLGERITLGPSKLP